MTAELKMTIGILGGTGDLGSGLAKVWAVAGHTVIIGSRSSDKAAAKAAEPGHNIRGEDNIAAAQNADILVLAVPFASHEATIVEIRQHVRGKIFVDAAEALTSVLIWINRHHKALGAGIRITGLENEPGHP